MIPAGWNNANIRAFRDCFGKIAMLLNQNQGGMPVSELPFQGGCC